MSWCPTSDKKANVRKRRSQGLRCKAVPAIAASATSRSVEWAAFSRYKGLTPSASMQLEPRDGPLTTIARTRSIQVFGGI